METRQGDADVAVPAAVRLQLLHGYVQVVADETGVDLLHVKGAAVHESLQIGARGSMDVDVLVRPADVERFVAALQERGWKKLTGFDEGSAFSHAMNLHHELGLLDVHRMWPGFQISPAEAFDALWADREAMVIAGIACTVPSLALQRLILVLHYGRSGGQRASDLEAAWTSLSPSGQEDLKQLARVFDASLALAVATGDDGDFVRDPAYPLWRYFSQGRGGRLQEWRGRWSAARGPRAKTEVLRRLVMVNPDLLAYELGRTPRLSDYGVAYWRRADTAVRDARHELERRWGARR